MNIYSIKDNETGEYSPPFNHENDTLATRHTKSSMKMGLLADYPPAYALWYIGEFDKTTGKINQNLSPHIVVELNDLVDVIDKGVK